VARGTQLEICVDDIAGVHAAIAGAVDRIDRCSALALGGLNPSACLVEAALSAARPCRAAQIAEPAWLS
jgi:copper homeostasis protein